MIGKTYLWVFGVSNTKSDSLPRALLFLSVIVKTGEAIPIGIALAAVIFLGGSVSGGHFNPAVSVMMYLNNQIDLVKLVLYVITQCVGGALALLFYRSELALGGV